MTYEFPYTGKANVNLRRGRRDYLLTKMWPEYWASVFKQQRKRDANA